MIPATTERVAQNTKPEMNERIQEQIEDNVAWYKDASPDEINRRLEELDREWDIERVLEANAAGVSLMGFAAGVAGAAVVGRLRYILPVVALPAAVAGFLLWHAIQGWCPPVPLLRRLGFRTQSEIDQERYALKVLRGDFQEVADAETEASTDAVMQAVNI